jgi:HEAT repeat protein
MKTLRNRILLRAFFLFVLLAIGCALFSYFSEPRYKGRPLSSWLREYDQNRWDQSEAAIAIRAIGTNAAPTLAKMVSAQPQFSLGRLAQKLRPRFEILPSTEPMENHRLAMHGFRLLGPTASNALPLLLKSFIDPRSQSTHYVFMAIEEIGEPALPALHRLLTSTNAETQRYAVISILTIKSDDLATVTNLLAHPAPGVRGETYFWIHTRRHIPIENQLQILLRGIDDPHTYAAQRAVIGLRGLSCYATNALPRLYELQSTTNARLAREITTAVTRIEKHFHVSNSAPARAR